MLILQRMCDRPPGLSSPAVSRRAVARVALVRMRFRPHPFCGYDTSYNLLGAWRTLLRVEDRLRTKCDASVGELDTRSEDEDIREAEYHSGNPPGRLPIDP